jgi:HEAT repeat protein
MDENKLVRNIERAITKHKRKPRTYMDTIKCLLKLKRKGENASYHRVINDLFKMDFVKGEDIATNKKKKRNLLNKRRSTINRRIYDSDLCFIFFIDFDGNHFHIITDPETIYKKWLAEFKLRDRKETKESRERLIKNLTDELNRKYEVFKIKNPVLKFLEDIEKHIEYEFKHLTFFNSKQKTDIENQYIPINVTSEITPHHFAQSDLGFPKLKRRVESVGTLNKYSVEPQFRQTPWDEIKKQEKKKSIVVLSDPGMGKSTLLRREMMLLASEERQNITEDKKTINDVVIPLFLKLFEIEDEKKEIFDSILSLVKRYYPETSLDIMDFLEDKLRKGQCLLLLDSLDGVPLEYRNRLSEKLHRFKRNYDCRIICTSRIVGYIGNFIHDALEIEIVPFNQKQIEQYVINWFANTVPPENNDINFADRFLIELQTMPQIRGLLQNPLLLSLMCNLYHRKKISFPASRSKVYKTSVDFMLRKWSQKKKPRSDWKIISTTKLLGELAYLFAYEGKEIFSEDDLYLRIERYLKGKTVSSDFKRLNASDLIQEITEIDGILIKADQKKRFYTFFHRTFQEYLVATYLNQIIKNDLKKGMDLIKTRLWDFDWHEILILLAGLIDDPLPIVEMIMNEKDDIFCTQLLLAGQFVANSELSFSPLVSRIAYRVHQLWRDYPEIPDIKSTIISLGKKYSQMIEWISESFSRRNYKEIKEATFILQNIGTPNAAKILVNYLITKNDKNSISTMASGNNCIVSQTLDYDVDQLIDSIKDKNPLEIRDTLLILKKYKLDRVINAISTLTKDSQPIVRETAIEALKEIGTDKAIQLILDELISKDSPSRNIASKVLREIGQGYFDFLSFAANFKSPIENDLHLFPLWGVFVGFDEIIFDFYESLYYCNSDENKQIVYDVLGEIGNSIAIKCIKSLLNSKNKDIRCFASKALEEIEEKLRKKNKHQKDIKSDPNNEDIEGDFLGASNRITKQKLTDIPNILTDEEKKRALKKLRLKIKNQDYYIQREAVKALGEIGGHEVIEILTEILKGEESLIQMDALIALNKIGGEQVVDSLKVALKNGDVFVRNWAAIYLREIGGDKAVKALIEALNDIDKDVRIEAAKALGLIGNHEAIDALSMNLKYDYSSVKSYVAWAVSRIGGEKAIDILIDRLHDKDLPYDDIERIYINRLKYIGTLEILEKIIQHPKINIFNEKVFSFARLLAKRYCKTKTPFIPVYPKLINEYKKCPKSFNV